MAVVCGAGDVDGGVGGAQWVPTAKLGIKCGVHVRGVRVRGGTEMGGRATVRRTRSVGAAGVGETARPGDGDGGNGAESASGQETLRQVVRACGGWESG